jgi:hypothetical protein
MWTKKSGAKTRLLIFSFLLASTSNSAMASAGFYPVEVGEALRSKVCVPKNLKPPLLLQINNGSKKPVSVARIDSFPRSAGECGKDERKLFINWVVDRPGTYGLSFYSPKSKVTFTGWPDGIEAKRR